MPERKYRDTGRPVDNATIGCPHINEPRICKCCNACATRHFREEKRCNNQGCPMCIAYDMFNPRFLLQPHIQGVAQTQQTGRVSDGGGIKPECKYQIIGCKKMNDERHCHKYKHSHCAPSGTDIKMHQKECKYQFNTPNGCSRMEDRAHCSKYKHSFSKPSGVDTSSCATSRQVHGMPMFQFA
jgi:hypothetical protein